MAVKHMFALGFAILGSGVGVFAVWRFLDREPPSPELPKGAAINRLYEQAAEQPSVDHQSESFADAAIVNSIIDSGRRLGISDAAELGDAVQRSIDSYALPDVQSFIDWQLAEGITPIPKWQANPDQFQSAWDTLRATFVFADIDASKVRVVQRSRDDDRSVEAQVQLKSKTRPDGRPFLADPTGDLVVCEVLLPGIYPTLDGDFVETELGIEMTKRPDTGGWVITGIYHYTDIDPPPRIAIPPL